MIFKLTQNSHLEECSGVGISGNLSNISQQGVLVEVLVLCCKTLSADNFNANAEICSKNCPLRC